MQTALLLILIIIGNLALYWVFFGQKKFQQKVEQPAPQTVSSEPPVPSRPPATTRLPASSKPLPQTQKQ